ncbi:MAG: RNA ligase partner protein [Elusimicrobiota bacterium]
MRRIIGRFLKNSSQKFVILDTSLFVNPASAHFFGRNPTESFSKFLELCDSASGVHWLMPPSIYRELMYFVEEKKIPRNLLIHIEQRAPKKHEILVPGIFIHDLVENMRDRVDRGLRLAERHVREALLVSPPVKSDKPVKGVVYPDAEAVGRLRETYRRIMREGFLDSKADVDLLLLSYELSGLLVSADQGVIDWAEKMGIQILPYDQLLPFLKKQLS